MAEVVRLNEAELEGDAPVVTPLAGALGKDRLHLQDVGHLAVAGVAGHGVAGVTVRAGELGIQIGGVGEQPVQGAIRGSAFLGAARLLEAAVDLDRLEEGEIGHQRAQPEGEGPRHLGRKGGDVEGGLLGWGPHPVASGPKQEGGDRESAEEDRRNQAARRKRRERHQSGTYHGAEMQDAAKKERGRHSPPPLGIKCGTA